MMVFLRHKRGNAIEPAWSTLFALIIVIVVFLATASFVKEVVSSEFFEKNYLAQDLSLTTDTIIASPNDMVFHYDRSTKDFSFEIKDNKIKVYKWYISQLVGSIAQSFYIGSNTVQIDNFEVTPIFDEAEGKPLSVMPVNLLVARYQNHIFFFNGKETILSRQEDNLIKGVKESVTGTLDKDSIYIIEMPLDIKMQATAQNQMGQGTCTWAQIQGLDAAINANPFTVDFGYKPTYIPLGIAGAQGSITDYRGDYKGIFAVFSDNSKEILSYDEKNKVLSEAVIAVSGDLVPVKDCVINIEQIKSDSTALDKIPRTFIGINQEESKLYFIVFKQEALMSAAAYLRDNVCQCTGSKKCTMLSLGNGKTSTLYAANKQMKKDFSSENSCIFPAQGVPVAISLGIKNG
jgi:hypothetical protein